MIILQKGYNPHPFGPWSTAKYLVEYMKGTVLRFKRTELQRHVIFKNLSAIKAYELLEEISSIETGLPFGKYFFYYIKSRCARSVEYIKEENQISFQKNIQYNN